MEKKGDGLIKIHLPWFKIINNNHQRVNALIFYHILLTNSGRQSGECVNMDIIITRNKGFLLQ